MKATSPYWNEETGVCKKHLLPSVPCPACMADEGDEDVEFVVGEATALTLEGENFAGRKLTLVDMVPANLQNPRFIKAFN